MGPTAWVKPSLPHGNPPNGKNWRKVSAAVKARANRTASGTEAERSRNRNRAYPYKTALKARSAALVKLSAKYGSTPAAL
jgi:hypothetical protein